MAGAVRHRRGEEMGNLNLILFISFAGPLVMTLFVCRGKARTLLLFLLIGLVVCLFCGEMNTIIMNMLSCDRRVFTRNFTPLIEEVCKALPILAYVFLYRPDRRTLLECSLLVGVGFAVQENALILSGMAGTVSLSLALIRGFAAGISHGLTTLAVGYGMSFVHTRRKLFATGTLALLSAAVIEHSLYNTLVQSEHELVGFLLPVLTFIPVIILLKKTKA